MPCCLLTLLPAWKLPANPCWKEWWLSSSHALSAKNINASLRSHKSSSIMQSALKANRVRKTRKLEQFKIWLISESNPNQSIWLKISEKDHQKQSQVSAQYNDGQFSMEYHGFINHDHIWSSVLQIDVCIILYTETVCCVPLAMFIVFCMTLEKWIETMCETHHGFAILFGASIGNVALYGALIQCSWRLRICICNETKTHLVGYMAARLSND